MFSGLAGLSFRVIFFALASVLFFKWSYAKGYESAELKFTKEKLSASLSSREAVDRKLVKVVNTLDSVKEVSKVQTTKVVSNLSDLDNHVKVVTKGVIKYVSKGSKCSNLGGDFVKLWNDSSVISLEGG